MKLALASILAVGLAGLAGGCNDHGGAFDAGPCTQFDGGGVGCYRPSPNAVTRTACGGAVHDHCDGPAAPNLACANPPPPPDTRNTGDVVGFAHAFYRGPDTDGLTLSVFDATTLPAGIDPANLTPVTATSVVVDDNRRVCDADPAVGCHVLQTDACAAKPCNDGLGPATMRRRDDGLYCRAGSCVARARWEGAFTLSGVPLDRPLLLRVVPTTPAAPAPDPRLGIWVTTYVWNIVVPTNARACAGADDNACRDAQGRYHLDIGVLARIDWSGLPSSAGLSGGIGFNQSLVVGEVRDCDGVRLSNAVVAVSPTADRQAYFDDDPSRPLPRVDAVSTRKSAGFGLFNVAPGKFTVEASGSLTANGVPARLGCFAGALYANTAALVTLDGTIRCP